MVYSCIEYRTRNQEVEGSTHNRSTVQATLSKLLTYVCSGQLSLLPSAGREISIATAMRWRPSVADWGDGVSASCTVCLVVR